MSSQANYQDLKPLIFVKDKTHVEKIKSGEFVVEKKQDGGKNKVSALNKTGIDSRKLDTIGTNDDVGFKLPVISHNFKIQLQQERQKKNLSQDELAKKCNIPVKFIKDYEAGNGIVNNAHIQLINKALGSKLKKNA